MNYALDYKLKMRKFVQSNKIPLTPKGPTCVFWQHRNFGQVRVIGDLHILG